MTSCPRLLRRAAALLAMVGCTICSAQSPHLAQPNELVFEGGMVMEKTPPASSAYPAGDFGVQLQSAGGMGGGCGPDGCTNNEWGCGGSPYRTGPGRCDDWRTGPVWRVSVDGICLYREDTDLDALATDIGTTLATADQFQNFDHGGGARILAIGHWPQMRGYEMAVGYVGIPEWNSSIVLPVVAIPPDPGPPALVGLNERRTLNYQSTLHSLEINWQRLTESTWKPYAGVRYFVFDEDVADITTQYSTAPLAVGETAITTATQNLVEVENNLIGFQLGVRRDLWHVSRKIYLEGFVNGGLYCNFINRNDIDAVTTTSTEILDDDPGTVDVDETGDPRVITNRTGNTVKTERTRAAYVGEASVALVWKLNSCCALRSGYQAMYLSGLEMADDAFLGISEREQTFVHGFFGGLEYRR